MEVAQKVTSDGNVRMLSQQKDIYGAILPGINTCQNESAIDADDNEDQIMDIQHLKVYGYLIIISAWLMFIVSVGTILNLWDWCFKVRPDYLRQFEEISWMALVLQQVYEQNKVVENYYLLCFVLNFVILWIWAVVSWISMKLFRHSKGGGS
jgi:hypothetical protein